MKNLNEILESKEKKIKNIEAIRNMDESKIDNILLGSNNKQNTIIRSI